MNTAHPPDSALNLFRHTLATLAYRAAKTLHNAPPTFADFNAGPGGRTPIQILAHMGDLFDWALSIAKGSQSWKDSKSLPWNEEVARFFAALKAFDDFLASSVSAAVPLEKLFQGPVADALTHTGQLAMLRRMSGSQLKGENYFVAEVEAGRVGADQAKPKREF
jgi:hypothetical protein